VYRIALLDAAPTATDAEAASPVDPQEDRSGPQPIESLVEEGERRTVTVETVGDQSDGIAKVERGYVVTVPEARPGQRPEVRIKEVRQNVAFASIISGDRP